MLEFIDNKSDKDMKHRPELKIDLRQDLVRLAREEIQRSGYKTHDLKTEDEVILTCLEVQRQHIARHPRKIAKAANFLCPREYSQALGHIEHLIKTGGDLNPHRSTRNVNRAHRDPLLLDWNIHHLHLSISFQQTKQKRTTLSSQQYVEGTEHLLYCWIDDQCVYFIGVFTHDDFENPKLVDVLHQNWPELISRFRLQGTKGEELSTDQIKTLRIRRLNTVISTSDGVAYAPFGGGVTNAGHRIVNTFCLDSLCDWAAKTEQDIRVALPNQLLKIQRKYSGNIPDPVIVEMCAFAGNLFLVKTDQVKDSLGCLVYECLDGKSELHFTLFTGKDEDLILSDEQWQRIEGLLWEQFSLQLSHSTLPYNPRMVLNGILWILKSNSPWEDLPSDYQIPWNTCAKYFYQWIQTGVFQKILQFLPSRKNMYKVNKNKLAS